MSTKKVVKPKGKGAPKASFRDVFYEKYAPIATGLGAAVVIVGALFKIQHWPGGSPILTAGLATEACLFVMFAFAPQHKDPDWTRVYPQLGDDYEGAIGETEQPGKGLTKKLDTMLADARVDDQLIQSLGNSFRGLSENVSKLSHIGDAAVATNEYAQNAKVAAKSLQEMNKSYGATVDAMSSMATASDDAKKYHTQVQTVTKNLGALNAVYEMELQDTNNHLKALNKFYGNISAAMENVNEATKDTQQFKAEMSKLTNNLSSLNNVYGNMLTAMKG
ncbi:gliding motility-associated protein GldL [Catalinimonas alkaloidigena]|uniref:Gliding motility-associated protein GldL n=1 Tax=Catalinimonas alkaloidigena TaxID=1075417 RepID=A0A1G9MQ49_9BACT|nr:gliding motility protein GldL [Catalinimonas alkaloidigena]SDL75765.1 gliding motility-associated protein GldL [Catalinimonas alkaloidigena]